MLTHTRLIKDNINRGYLKCAVLALDRICADHWQETLSDQLVSGFSKRPSRINMCSPSEPKVWIVLAHLVFIAVARTQTRNPLLWPIQSNVLVQFPRESWRNSRWKICPRVRIQHLLQCERGKIDAWMYVACAFRSKDDQWMHTMANPTWFYA